ncbi:hypothetical protein FRACA_2200021 [Frankia canadensis]|uniref:Uncharacterized protein n=1 Tax=Frankia canadensis TaxID=1836972 RepID=A0A2I2KR32_9ACTN|nr:hypothetical protein [Frankia canadensis]SNQ48127.1 hypothetical protein FRACA_2200021 [Frankia canadensis]SOU55417.1 hypothetical protein FRACA_2200021 [Frankia canadensis]
MLALLILLSVWGIVANLSVALVVLSRVVEDRRDVADWQRTQDMIRAHHNA